MSSYQILLSGGVFNLQSRTVIQPDNSSPEWQEYQTWLTAGNSPLPPSTVGQGDLVSSKAKRRSEIDAYAAGLRNAVVRGRSAGEMASWAIKINEARLFQSSGLSAQAPTLAAIATIRGISLASIAQKVLDQSTPFLQAEAYIDGIRGKHCDNIEAMLTVPEIITYNWLVEWPGMAAPT